MEASNQDDSSSNSDSSVEANSAVESRTVSVFPTHSQILALGSGQRLPPGLTHTIYEGNADDFLIWRRDLPESEHSIHSSAFYSIHQAVNSHTTEPASPPPGTLARQPGSYSTFKNWVARCASGEIGSDEEYDPSAFMPRNSSPVPPVDDELRCVGQGPVSEMSCCPNCAQAVRYTDHKAHQEVCKRTYVGHPGWPFKCANGNNGRGRGAGASSTV